MPIELIAATLKKYVLPLVRPVMTRVKRVLPGNDCGASGTSPLYGTTRYPTIGELPLLDGMCQCTVALPLPGAAEAEVGADGAPGT